MTTAITAPRNNGGADPHPTVDLSIRSVSEAFAKSGMFPGIRDAAQAFVKIMAGRELGFGPFASMKGVHIIQGNTALSASLMAARIKTYAGGKYDYRIVTHTDDGCELEFFQNGKPVGKSPFMKADAEKAGLLKKDNWRNYPRNMYFSRALSNGAKWYCADAFMGKIYTPEELGADVDGETGEVIAEKSPKLVGAKSIVASVNQVDEAISVRIHDDESLVVELGALGFSESDARRIARAMQKKVGGFANWRDQALAAVQADPQRYVEWLASKSEER